MPWILPVVLLLEKLKVAKEFGEDSLDLTCCSSLGEAEGCVGDW